MLKFLCIRHNPQCRAGTWFFATDHGEPLFQARIEGNKLIQKSRVGIPWDTLAPYIIEPGFRISRDKLYRQPRRAIPMGEEATADVKEFQAATEDIIEDELERRARIAEPTVRQRGGVIHSEGNRSDAREGEALPNEPRGDGEEESPRDGEH